MAWYDEAIFYHIYPLGKWSNKKHFIPVHILMYTLPGVPSVYYGSEFGIEGLLIN